MADKHFVSCDHCGSTIIIDFPVPTMGIFWCAVCIMDGGRKTLKDHGVLLQSTDATYQANGYAYWRVDKNRTHDWGYVVSQIPKKGMGEPVPEPMIVDLQLDLEVDKKPSIVCEKSYYGVGLCSCGRCSGVGYVPNRNVFGY